MPIEPPGIAQVHARIAEIAARFGPPPPRTEPADREVLGKSEQAGPGTAAGNSAGTQSFDFATALAKAAGKSGLDPKLLAAVVRVESDGDPSARSPKGAMGLMQLMPGTAAKLGVTDPFDPVQNMVGGSRHLKGLIDSYGDISLGLAAYNAGEGAVDRHQGIPPFRETETFVRRVLDIYDSNQP